MYRPLQILLSLSSTIILHLLFPHQDLNMSVCCLIWYIKSGQCLTWEFSISRPEGSAGPDTVIKWADIVDAVVMCRQCLWIFYHFYIILYYDILYIIYYLILNIIYIIYYMYSIIVISITVQYNCYKYNCMLNHILSQVSHLISFPSSLVLKISPFLHQAIAKSLKQSLKCWRMSWKVPLDDVLIFMQQWWLQVWTVEVY